MRRKNTRVDMKKTGENIEKYMKENEVSISELAEKLEVSPSAVRNYIRGVNLPEIEKMYSICKIFKVDIKDIIVERTEEKTREEV